MPTLPHAYTPYIVILGAGASIAAYDDWGATLADHHVGYASLPVS
jgi:hypothetical protein